MKKNKTWLTIGIILFAQAMNRRFWDSIGGIESLPYWGQISTIVLMLIILIAACKIERKKMNKFQYRLSKLSIIFSTIMSIILIAIIVLNNSFPVVGKQCETVLVFMLFSVLVFFAVYVVILKLRNIKNIK